MQWRKWRNWRKITSRWLFELVAKSGPLEAGDFGEREIVLLNEQKIARTFSNDKGVSNFAGMENYIIW